MPGGSSGNDQMSTRNNASHSSTNSSSDISPCNDNFVVVEYWIIMIFWHIHSSFGLQIILRRVTAKSCAHRLLKSRRNGSMSPSPLFLARWTTWWTSTSSHGRSPHRHQARIIGRPALVQIVEVASQNSPGGGALNYGEILKVWFSMLNLICW